MAEGDRARQLAVAIVDAWPYMGDGVSIGNDAELRELRLSEITDYVRGTLDAEVAERVGELRAALQRIWPVLVEADGTLSWIVHRGYSLMQDGSNAQAELHALIGELRELARAYNLPESEKRRLIANGNRPRAVLDSTRAALATAGAPGSQEDGR